MDFPKDISTLYRKMHVSLNSTLDSMGLSGSKAMFVFCLYAHEPMTQNDLCRHLDMDKSTVAKMITRLEKDGLVTKKANPEDMRSHLVHLTDAAHELVPQAQKVQADWVDRVTVDLTAEEKQAFFAQLCRVAQKANELCGVS